MTTITAAWVLSLLLSVRAAAGEGPSPWDSTLPETAQAIADACADAPLAGGGADWCAAVLAVQSFQESRYNPGAVHDHGQGHGEYGLHDATLAIAAVPPDARGQTFVAVELIKESFEACGASPLDERLALYMSGFCSERRALSRHRLHLAAKLLRAHPVE